MKKWLRFGICLVLTICLLILPACKTGPASSDSTGVTPTHDPTVATDSADIAFYKERVPMYFDLPTENGLEVYIWRATVDNYLCGLLPAKATDYTQKELEKLSESPVTIETMRQIVAYHIEKGNVTKEQITVHGIKMPYSPSSYPYTPDEAFQRQVNYLLWAEDIMLAYVKANRILDTVTFDIDSDGTEEECILVPGSTSAYLTILFLVLENGELEYFNQFSDTSSLYSLAFEKNENGQATLLATELEYCPDPVPGKQHRLSLGVEQGNIVIYDNGKLFIYSGRQGIDSPEAPKKQSDS